MTLQCGVSVFLIRFRRTEIYPCSVCQIIICICNSIPVPLPRKSSSSITGSLVEFHFPSPISVSCLGRTRYHPYIMALLDQPHPVDFRDDMLPLRAFGESIFFRFRRTPRDHLQWKAEGL